MCVLFTAVSSRQPRGGCPGALERLELAGGRGGSGVGRRRRAAHRSCSTRKRGEARRSASADRAGRTPACARRASDAARSAIQRAQRAASVTRVPAPMQAARSDMGEVRAPRRRARAPRIEWQATQPARGKRQAARASAPSRRRGRRRLARAARRRSRAGGSTTTYERHLRVLPAAELGALAAIARPARSACEAQLVHPARDHVDLAGERRHPEAVDDVAAVQAEHDRAAGRQMRISLARTISRPSAGSRSAAPTTSRGR